MAGNTSSGGQASGSRASVVESLAQGPIKRRMRADAAQHPVTIVPFTLSILMLIIYLVFPPFLGPVWAIILCIVFAVLGTGTYIWRYAVRFNSSYEAEVQRIMAALEMEGSVSGEQDVKDLRDTLQAGFAGLNTEEGLKALEQLDYVYERLLPVLESKRATDPMAVAHVPTLAEGTYRQGLSVLGDALRLMTAIHSTSNERLATEVVQFEKELEALRSDESQTERARMREESIASHKERLDLVSQQQQRVEQLLHQSESCEASLHRTRIEIAALKADSGESSVRDVTDSLRKTINHAKEVQEELKKLGY